MIFLSTRNRIRLAARALASVLGTALGGVASYMLTVVFALFCWSAIAGRPFSRDELTVISQLVGAVFAALLCIYKESK